MAGSGWYWIWRSRHLHPTRHGGIFSGWSTACTLLFCAATSHTPCFVIASYRASICSPSWSFPSSFWCKFKSDCTLSYSADTLLLSTFSCPHHTTRSHRTKLKTPSHLLSPADLCRAGPSNTCLLAHHPDISIWRRHRAWAHRSCRRVHWYWACCWSGRWYPPKVH